MVRSVDTAMGEQRPEKELMRQLWVNAVSAVDADRDGPPLYLTLPGAQGLDIRSLIDAGIVRRAENGAIVAEDVWKVVAVERSSSASLSLKRHLNGLRVLTQDIAGILASTGPLRWPQGANERWCRAHVVNLDFDGALRCERAADGFQLFPTVQLVAKIAQLHNKPPALDWTLCLTLAAEIEWNRSACDTVRRFLCENFKHEEQFAVASRTLLGDRLFDRLTEGGPVDFRTLDHVDKQALLMVFVPKKIVAETYKQGWHITTMYNLRYGGHRKSQRMVSWIMRFKREPRVAGEPNAVYSESLTAALAHAGAIDPDGTLYLS